MEKYKNFIGGNWIPSDSGEVIKSVNPANRHEIIGTCQKGTAKDVERAIDAAEKAFERWSRVPAPKRGDILLKAAQLLEKQKEPLARLMTREMGKVITESRGDVQEAIDIAKYIAGEGRRLFGKTTTSELRNKFCMYVRRPIGVVGIITPWNFPIAIPGWKVFPALICGNAIVFKPASDTPICAMKFAEILMKAGVPKGVINVVTGAGDTVGEAILKSPRIDAVSFTGSCEVGRKVLACGAESLKRTSLELGGKNAIIVMDDANLELAVDGAIWGGFGTSGQRCTAASRLIVHERVLKGFTDMFVKRVKRLKLGDGLKPTTDVGPVINERQLHRIHSYTNIGKQEGAKLLCGGQIATKGSLAKGFFYEPTVFTDVTKDMRIAQEEIFGPTVAIMPVKSFEEAIEVCNSTEYGLSSAIYTQDVNRAFKAIEELDTGLTYVNASTIGAETHLPFGGVKNTGTGGREAGPTAIEEFSEIKAVYFDYSGTLQRAQIDVE